MRCATTYSGAILALLAAPRLGGGGRLTEGNVSLEEGGNKISAPGLVTGEYAGPDPLRKL